MSLSLFPFPLQVLGYTGPEPGTRQEARQLIDELKAQQQEEGSGVAGARRSTWSPDSPPSAGQLDLLQKLNYEARVSGFF